MTITEVSREYDTTPDTLRYYEKIGLIPRVNRNRSGIRDYTEDDCRWVEFIKCMRSAGLPIEALKEYVDLFLKGDDTIAERKELLIDQRRKLQLKIKDMNATLERLNNKIDKYDSLTKCERNLK